MRLWSSFLFWGMGRLHFCSAKNNGQALTSQSENAADQVLNSHITELKVTDRR